MESVNGWLVAAFVLSGTACADLPSAPRPGPLAPVFNQETAWVGGQEYPVFESEEDAKAAMGWAQITSTRAYVFFDGNTAIAGSEMGYIGNYGEQIVRLTAANSKGSVTETNRTRETSLLPADRHQVTGTTRAALLGPACGGVATVNVTYEARVVFVMKHNWIPTTLDEEVKSTGRDTRQPECPPEPCPAGYTGGDGSQWSSYWLGNAYECEQEKDEPSGEGGGSGCLECVDEPVEPTYCRVRYSWWKDTGEIFRWTVLFCA